MHRFANISQTFEYVCGSDRLTISHSGCYVQNAHLWLCYGAYMCKVYRSNYLYRAGYLVLAEVFHSIKAGIDPGYIQAIYVRKDFFVHKN